jgi:hypothetical protein
MHFGFKGRSAIYGIFWPQPIPKDGGLLRCGILYVLQAFKGFIAPGYIADSTGFGLKILHPDLCRFRSGLPVYRLPRSSVKTGQRQTLIVMQ